MLANDATTTNTQDYYQLKEVANSAIYDSIDYSYYAQTRQVRILKEVFVENFLRRFAETVNITDTYNVEFYDLYESPPKVSVKVDSLTVLGRNFGTVVTPEDINNNSVNHIFRRIYSNINLGESLDQIRVLDDEESRIAEDLHEDIELSRIIRSCMVHFNIIERYFDRVIERIGYQVEIRDLSSKHAELMKELRRAERSIFKTNHNRRKIYNLNKRLDSLEFQMEQKKQLSSITKEQLSNTLETLQRVGLSKVARALESMKFGYNRREAELFVADSQNKSRVDVLGVDPMSMENLVYLLINQTNRNFRVDDYENVALLALLNKEVDERLCETRSNLEANRAEKHMLEDKISRDVESYAHRVGFENGKLVLYRDNLPKVNRTSLVALFALKLICATKYSLHVEELPKQMQVEADIAKLDDWFRDYTTKVYNDTMTRIEELENDRDYSINR
jgi:hypothetical protein